MTFNGGVHGLDPTKVYKQVLGRDFIEKVRLALLSPDKGDSFRDRGKRYTRGTDGNLYVVVGE